MGHLFFLFLSAIYIIVVYIFGYDPRMEERKLVRDCCKKQTLS